MDVYPIYRPPISSQEIHFPAAGRYRLACWTSHQWAAMPAHVRPPAVYIDTPGGGLWVSHELTLPLDRD
jgi:hypothetical protein